MVAAAAPLDEAKAKSVLHQVEFYFSDRNLPRAKFLRETVEQSGDGLVSLALICSFSRMKSHLGLDAAVKPETVPEETARGRRCSGVPRRMRAHTENSVEANQGCAESALPREQVTNQDNSEVFLFSTNPRNKNKVMAKGGLVSTYKTCVVGGDMLGDEYFGVAIHAVTNIGDQRLLRSYENMHTVRDAIGCVVAWPRSYVKRAKKTASDRSQNNLDN